MARQGKNLSWKSWWKVCCSIYWNASWAVFLSSLVLSGCGESGSNQDGVDNGPQIIPLNVLKLQQPEDCGDLKNYVVTSLIERYTAIPRLSYYYCPVNGDEQTPVPPPASATPTTPTPEKRR